MGWKGFVLSTALLAGLQGAAAFGFDGNGDQVIVYSSGSTPGLAEICKDPNVDAVILSFVDKISGQSVSADFGGNPTGADIKQCQSNKKSVLVSLGGETFQGAWGSPDEAKKSAQKVWEMYGAGKSGASAFDGVPTNGFDLDFEKPLPNLEAFTEELLNLKDAAQNAYLTVAPQCVMPDANVGDIIEKFKDRIDALLVQFYNNKACGIPEAYDGAAGGGDSSAGGSGDGGTIGGSGNGGLIGGSGNGGLVGVSASAAVAPTSAANNWAPAASAQDQSGSWNSGAAANSGASASAQDGSWQNPNSAAASTPAAPAPQGQSSAWNAGATASAQDGSWQDPNSAAAATPAPSAAQGQNSAWNAGASAPAQDGSWQDPNSAAAATPAAPAAPSQSNAWNAGPSAPAQDGSWQDPNSAAAVTPAAPAAPSQSNAWNAGPSAPAQDGSWQPDTSAQGNAGSWKRDDRAQGETGSEPDSNTPEAAQDAPPTRPSAQAALWARRAALPKRALNLNAWLGQSSGGSSGGAQASTSGSSPAPQGGGGSSGKGPKVFFGTPGSRTAIGSPNGGYSSPKLLAQVLIDFKKKYPNFGGISIWSYQKAVANTEDKDFISQAKKVLKG